MRKFIYVFAALFFTTQFSAAQSNAQAEKILTDLLNTAKANAVKTNFKLTLTEKNDPQPQSVSGTFTLKGSKFVLEMENIKSWYDGKTQWSYVSQNNEVSVSEPTEKELAETNPMAILSEFKAKCSIRFSAKNKSDKDYCIEMIPKVSHKDISKIEVEVNKSNGNLVSIKLINKNGSTSLLTLTNFQKGVNVSDAIFVFNASKYKGVTVNDLR